MEKYYEKNNQVIYNCDNLELLKKLEDNSINLIYCDILYNTGKVFDDYNDNFEAQRITIYDADKAKVLYMVGEQVLLPPLVWIQKLVKLLVRLMKKRIVKHLFKKHLQSYLNS